jgi:hypothetical protein
VHVAAATGSDPTPKGAPGSGGAVVPQAAGSVLVVVPVPARPLELVELLELLELLDELELLELEDEVLVLTLPVELCPETPWPLDPPNIATAIPNSEGRLMPSTRP